MRSWTLLSALFCAGVLGGCSSKPGGDVGEVRGAPISLIELNDMLHIGGANGRSPAQLADLEKQKSRFPRGYEAVKNGDLVVLWGTKPVGEGAVAEGAAQEIAAYQKNVPTEGGYVLFSGGTIKKMTPTEFNAAPKGGKPG